MSGQDFKKIVADLRQSFNTGKMRSLEFRKQQLRALRKMYVEHSRDFELALAKDLRKSKMEFLLTELNILLFDIDHVLSNMDNWVKPEKVAANTVTLLDNTTIHHDPYGVVLVIGAWNYPFQLPMLPVSGAIAAGNCVVIKPSEVSSAVEAALLKYIPLYVDGDCIRVVSGGVSETTNLLKERFDYIFFTGSTPVGKIVSKAANAHLTPTTLELGGKSPLYLDDSVDWDVAVRRIIWGKCCNLGQTCVAPDYILCSKAVQDKFIEKAKEVMEEFYGDDWQQSPDIGRIIDNKNFKRVANYIQDGTVAMGGKYDEADKWIEPTILTNVNPKSKIMQEEIFGPILPIINVDSVHDAINFINEREKPLAAYLFSTIPKVLEIFKDEVRSGGLCINDAIVHFSVAALPFGGVGSSGMGAYHGKASFDTFTHKKSVLGRGYSKVIETLSKNRYPPYTDRKARILTLALRERPLPSIKPLCYLLAFGLGALSLYVGQQLAQGNDAGQIIDRLLAARSVVTERFTK